MLQSDRRVVIRSQITNSRYTNGCVRVMVTNYTSHPHRLIAGRRSVTTVLLTGNVERPVVVPQTRRWRHYPRAAHA